MVELQQELSREQSSLQRRMKKYQLKVEVFMKNSQNLEDMYLNNLL
jgi:hypothetical protein